MLKSKRFVAYMISIVIFVLLALVKPYDLLALAGAISVLSAIYIGAESFKPSPKKPDEIG